MEVIDGQHRLEVARRNKLEIYYIIAPDVTTSDILLLNANEKPWGLADFVNSWRKQGKKDFDILAKYSEDYGGLSITLTSALLTGQKISHQEGIRKDIREGTLVVTHEEKAKDFLEKLASLRSYSEGEGWRDRDFISALQNVSPKMDWERFKNRLDVVKKQKGGFPIKRTFTTRDASLMIEDIYNFDMRVRTRIY